MLSSCGYAVCGAPLPRLVCAEYFKSKAVVTAKLIRTKAIIDKDGFVTANVYYMRTAKLLRGTIAPEFEIYEGNDSGRAGFDWKVGESYLLFLFPSVETKSAAWGLDGCGNSGPLERAEPVLKQVEGFATQQGGKIQIAIGSSSISMPVAGVHVTVQGIHHDHAATTNERGQAEIRLPAGQYSVESAGYRTF